MANFQYPFSFQFLSLLVFFATITNISVGSIQVEQNLETGDKSISTGPIHPMMMMDQSHKVGEESQAYLGCGGILNGSTPGSIEYKLEQVYDANERCVWLINNRDTGRQLVLTLYSQGFATINDYLEVYYEDSDVLNYLHKLYYIQSQAKIQASVMIVVFRSGAQLPDRNGTGFKLDYSWDYNAGVPTDPTVYQGDHRITDDPVGFFEDFPPQGYRDSFDYTWILNPGQERTTLTFHYAYFKSDVYDLAEILIYTARATSYPIARYNGGDGPWSVVINSRDPIFIFLHPANNLTAGNNTGIQFYWNMDTPPNFVHKPQPITTTTEGSNGAAGNYVFNFFWEIFFTGIVMAYHVLA